MACALFAACTNDDNGVTNPDTTQSNGEQAFIAVRLMAPGAMTRSFQYGSDAENAVTTARFYFFNDEGEVVAVDNGVNYKDVSNPTFNDNSGNPAGNIESTSSQIVVLENATVWPTKMAVVLNPPASLTSSKSLTDLRAAGEYGAAASGSFVMSSSVYLNAGNEKIDAIDISTNIANNADAATANPAQVYVERVVARVDVKQNDSSLSDYEDDTDVEASEITGGNYSSGAKVMAVVKGWGLANRNKQSYLLKNIPNSTSDPSWSWNDATNHRSYWALTSEINDNTLDNDSYDDLSTEAASAMPETKYCQERTNTTTNPTELVVIAELQVDGTATTIAKYAGRYWTVDALLDQFLDMMPAIYYKASSGAPSEWTQIGKSQLKLRAGKDGENLEAYQALLDLQNEYQSGYSFASDNSGTSSMTVAEVQDILKEYVVLLWHNGKTYYHVPIAHSIADNDINAIVRNHLYNISVTGISGLGTPIPGTSTSEEPGGEPEENDPDPEPEPIDPEDPEEEESFLEAEIHILSWNVVSQDVVLGE